MSVKYEVWDLDPVTDDLKLLRTFRWRWVARLYVLFMNNPEFPFVEYNLSIIKKMPLPKAKAREASNRSTRLVR